MIHNVQVEEQDEYIWDMSKIKSSYFHADL